MCQHRKRSPDECGIAGFLLGKIKEHLHTEMLLKVLLPKNRSDDLTTAELTNTGSTNSRGSLTHRADDL